MTPITLLRCAQNNIATKTFAFSETGFVKVRDYDAGMWFSYDKLLVENIFELSQLLTYIEYRQDTFIVRGQLIQGFDPKCCRRILNVQEDGSPPQFEDVPGGIHWLSVDCDKIPLPPVINAVTNPEAAIRYLLSLLPPILQGVTVHWQLSCSFGLLGSDTISAHLWFWSDRPLSSFELKTWGVRYNEQTQGFFICKLKNQVDLKCG